MLALTKCVSKCNNKRYGIFHNVLNQKTYINFRITRVCVSFLIRICPIVVATNV